MTNKRPAPKTQPASDDVPSMMTALLHVHAASTRGALADAVAGACEQIAGARHGFVFIEQKDGALAYQAPGSETRRRSHRRVMDELGAALLTGTIDPSAAPIFAQALDGDDVVSAPIADALPLAEASKAAARSVTQAYAAAITGAGDRYGVLLALADDAIKVERIGSIAAHAGVACTNLGATDATVEEATAGVVPSIFDARKLETELQRELARSQRYGRDISICVIEATNLSLLRERFGLALTEQLYDRLGAELARHARDVDVIGAYRESGYTMLLAEAAPSGVEAAAQRLGAAAKRAGSMGTVPGLELHLAVGWATAPADGVTSEELFSAAQGRMYGDLARRVA